MKSHLGLLLKGQLGLSSVLKARRALCCFLSVTWSILSSDGSTCSVPSPEDSAWFCPLFKQSVDLSFAQRVSLMNTVLWRSILLLYYWRSTWPLSRRVSLICLVLWMVKLICPLFLTDQFVYFSLFKSHLDLSVLTKGVRLMSPFAWKICFSLYLSQLDLSFLIVRLIYLNILRVRLMSPLLWRISLIISLYLSVSLISSLF